MLVIPPKSHPAREFIELKHLAELADPRYTERLITKNQIILKYISKDSPIAGAVVSVNIYGLNELGQLELYQVSKFDIVTLWNFTTGDEN